MSTSNSASSLCQEPDAEWVGEALGVRIEHLEATRLGVGRGFQSTAWKLAIMCEGHSEEKTIILKSESTNADSNQFSRENNSFTREIGFYNHCAPKLTDTKPAIFASSNQLPAWLLMEDLSALRSGDQVIGLTLKDTVSAIKAAAKVHASFWMDEELPSHDWLPKHQFWFDSKQEEGIEDFFTTYGVRLGDKACDLLRAVLTQQEAIQAALDARPWSLIHGDLRADNLLFESDDSQDPCRLIDWSWTARSCPAIDIAFLIGGSTPTSQRDSHHEELLLVWHRELIKRGVRNYPLSMARLDLQLAALRTMTTGVVLHGFSKNPDTSKRAALFIDDAAQRHAAYAIEIKAWEALPDPSAFQKGHSDGP